MNRDKLIDSLGGIDDDMIEEVDRLRNYGKKSKWIRWCAMVASFAIVLIISMFAADLLGTADTGPTDPILDAPASAPLGSSDASIELGVEQGVYVNNMLLFPDTDLSAEATADNVGSFVGYISLDNENILNVAAYKFASDDDATYRIIIPYDDAYYVYSFYCYEQDGSDNWPVDLLENAVTIEIRERNFQEIVVYLTLTDEETVTQMISFLGNLGPKSDIPELHQHYYALFHDRFAEGSLWIQEDGTIGVIEDAGLWNSFQDLITGDGRRIVVILDDHTCLYYEYNEGAGVLVCDSFGYILTDDQVEQINQLIGLT